MFAPDFDILRFPAWDCLPYDRVSPNAEIVSERIATLARLIEPGARPRIILTTVNALVQRVPPRDAFRGAAMTLQAGQDAPLGAIITFLEANGYNRAGTVMEPGEYANRGGILDLFPAGEPEPVRLDLFGDTIESLRRFEPDLTAQHRQDRRVPGPAPRLRGSPRPRQHHPLPRGLARPVRATAPPTIHSTNPISEGRRYPGIEHWAPLFHERMETLLDYTDDASVSLDHQSGEVLDARLDMIADHEEARRTPARDGEVPYRPLAKERLYLGREDWDLMLAMGPSTIFSPYAQPEGAPGIDAGGRPGPVFTKAGAGVGETMFTQLKALVTGAASKKRRTVIAAWTRGSRERITHLLRENYIPVDPVDSWADAVRQPPKTPAIITLGLERGFIAGDVARPRRAGPARRAHQPPTPPPQARRSVHRRGHRDRRGRPRRPPGIRHRPLRRPRDPARRPGPA